MPEDDLANEQDCYLTTVGRTSGEPREIEIWFALVESVVFLLSGSGTRDGRPAAHWVRNLVKTPRVIVRIAGRTFQGEARIVEPATEEDALARRLLVAKYQPSYGSDLTG